MHGTRKFVAGIVLLSVGAVGCSDGGSPPTDSAGAHYSTSVVERPTSAAAHFPTATRPINTMAMRTSNDTDRTALSVLPAPGGPFSIGVVGLPMADAIAFFPAKADTGRGQHPYVDAKVLAGSGLPVDRFATLTTSARVGAVPLSGKAPRPVVVLAPGFGSMIALSTSLAEHLASHGYVVVALQTDIAAEAAAMMPNTVLGTKRTEQVAASLDLIGSAAFEALVGPVDQQRIAVGGHSFAGSIAFNISLHDRRVAAVFDLDGRLFADAAATPTKIPSLVVTSSGSGETEDATLRDIVRAGTHTVAVGLLDAEHFDLTDAAFIDDILRNAGLPVPLGSIGPVATTNTSAIVQRFLDAVLSDARRVPTASVLVDGLPSTTADPFASGS